MLIQELSQVIKETDLVFEAPGLKVPEPSLDWKRKLEALEEACLPVQRAKLLMDMRSWQAEQMGLKKMSVPEAVKLLMGEAHTGQEDAEQRHTLEWMYCHHEDKVFEGSACTWGSKPMQYYKTEKHGLWHMPPFAKKEKWRCQYGMFNYLKRDVPYGVVLRLIECKKTKLFNAFQVLAPMDAWLTDADIDPIILGAIWEKPPGGNTSGREQLFFVAQWK